MGCFLKKGSTNKVMKLALKVHASLQIKTCVQVDFLRKAAPTNKFEARS